MIRPALGDGKLVVCDRFWDATLAYQGYGRGLLVDELARITGFAAGGLTPDLTFLLDIQAGAIAERLHKRHGGHDRMEREQFAFHERVADGYRALAAAAPDRIVVVDGTRPPEKIANVVREKILARLS